MALYIVGDIQGCHKELKALLEKAKFDKNKDQLWSAGDIVARGSDSLATIEFLQSLGDSFNSVLGNHDLHLMSIYYGIKKAKKSDKLDNLLASKNINSIIEWLAQFPLMLPLPDGKSYLSHAGISPQWTLTQAIENAQFVEKRLRAKDREKWLTRMYGNTPNSWHQVATKTERFRFTVNAFTRMRFCYQDGSLEFDCKSSPEDAPKDVKPWFTLLTEEQKNITWYFGHWAALMGETGLKNIIALDTGCVWGNHLTMIKVKSGKLLTQNSYL
ncbi:symmetrical bis(5'-nucleosyl)-tetraphosphatase [Thalassotalea eurytherma]|uniref:bis(5'-nucleosyl)-tetraphosphatase (symmetrical) n=1 Tax=Thalassotalea eurytherma TaxID=1144278 RepID=A0ABQ6H3U1_9GAMM|nr:symmetrical bis(5'-nucleosyl)-tetraphosphatase [Thalassotalea eurytherma]GLX82841.1 bis(5'-nucleosyl)-tetraphosphatase, symmetrical [Thalassotalea eurytherma]